MLNAFAQSKELLQSCEISYFKLIESIWDGPNDQPFHRFCTLMRKMKARSFLQENLVLNQELLDEKEMYQKAIKAPVELNAIRLTFFCSFPETKKWDAEESLPENHILGYAVIVKIKTSSDVITYMLESVVISPSVVFEYKDTYHIESISNYFVHNTREFETFVGTKDYRRVFKLKGSFFAQQNGLTSVCAHAALRTALNSSPYLSSQKVTNKQINNILKKPNYQCLSGLTQQEIELVVKNFGFGVHSANFLENTSIEYDHFIYPSLESCFPTILGIERWDAAMNQMTGHVVTVLGHTMNSDRWEPEACRGYSNYPIRPYIASSEWCCHYIISDDNYGMYSTLPADAIRNFIVPSKNPNRHVCMAVSIVPSGVKLKGYDAEQLAIIKVTKLINNVTVEPQNTWLKRMKEGNLVCRTLLLKKNVYSEFIKKYANKLTDQQASILNNLPENIWVSEISLPNLFTGNKRKLGDVIIKANATHEEHKEGKSLVFAWLPSFAQLGHEPCTEPWVIESHIPLIRSKEISVLEW